MDGRARVPDVTLTDEILAEFEASCQKAEKDARWLSRDELLALIAAARRGLSESDAPIPFQMADPVWPGLAKLAEECAEVVQVVMKIIGTAGTLEFRDGQRIERSRLIEEMGDVVAALRFVQEHALTLTERDELHRRANAKRALFEQWREVEANA